MIVFNDGLANFLALIPLVYMIPTFILYILILYTIRIKRHSVNYNGAFYTLFSLVCVIAMVMDLTIYYQGRLLGAPIYLPFVKTIPSDGAVPMIFMFIGYGSIYCGQLLNMLISFNRFSVIYLKAGYVDFWKRYMKFLLLGVFVIPILLTIQFTVTQPAMMLYDDTVPEMGYYLKEKINKPIYDKSLRSVILFGFTGMTSLYMNSYVLRHLMKHRKTVDRNAPIVVIAVSMSDLTPINARFLAYNLLTFSFECVIAVVQVLMIFIKYGKDNCCTHPVLLTMQLFVADVATLAPAWFLFFAHKQLRNEILRYFFCCRLSNIMTTFQHTTRLAKV